MRVKIIFVLCLAINICLPAQEDELAHLGQKAFDLMSDNIDSCFIYSDSLLHLATSSDSESWIEKSKFYRARCLAQNGESKKAEKLLLSYLTYVEADERKEEVANTLFELIGIYFKLEDREAEISTINRALVLFNELGDTRMIAKCTVAKGRHLRMMRNNEEATKNLKEAETIYEEIKDSVGLAEVYNAMGLQAAYEGDMKTAASYFSRESDMNRAMGQLYGLASSLGNLGFAHLRLNEIETGEKYILEALEIKKKLKNPDLLSMAMVQVAEINVLKNDYPTALKYSNEALTMAKQSDLPFTESQCYKQISYIYEQMGDHKEALKYHKDYEQLKDKIFNEKINENAQEMEAVYQTTEKEKEILNLKLEDQLKTSQISRQRTALVSALLALLLVSYLLYRIFGQKKKIDVQNQEKEVLLKEIHHRVKNNLQVITSLLRIQSHETNDEVASEALKDSQSRVQSMSLIHQDLYQHDNLTGIDMKDYLSKLIPNIFTTYKAPQDKITLDLDIQELRLDVETVVPLGLIINELVTNSLKYAFPDGRKGNLGIRLKEEKGDLILNVSDDGVGLQKDSKSDASTGFDLIKAFTSKLEAELDIVSNNGTEITLSIANFKKV